jgi:hypothetical protein
VILPYSVAVAFNCKTVVGYTVHGTLTQHAAEFHILQSVHFSKLLQFKPTNAQNFIKITVHVAELPEIPTVLLHAGNDNIQHLVYKFVCSLMIDRRGPKRVGVGVLYSYCKFNKTLCISWFEL